MSCLPSIRNSFAGLPFHPGIEAVTEWELAGKRGESDPGGVLRQWQRCTSNLDPLPRPNLPLTDQLGLVPAIELVQVQIDQ